MCNLQADIDRVDHVTATIQLRVDNMRNNVDSSKNSLVPVKDAVPPPPQEMLEHDYSEPRNLRPISPPGTAQRPPPPLNKKEQRIQKSGFVQQHHGHTLSPIKEQEALHAHMGGNKPLTRTPDYSLQLQNSLLNFTGGGPPNTDEPNKHDNKNNRGAKQINSHKKLAKTLILMDSNKKHLTGDLWKNSTLLFCPTANELATKFPSLLRQHNPDIVLIHTGVNDLDYVDGATVARSLAHTVQNMISMNPEIKIVISEITPRKINKDDQVILCNQHLHTYLDHVENVVLAIHSNLRTEDWEFHEDDKHFLQISIGKLAANLKAALRKTIGMAERPKKKVGLRKTQTDGLSELKKKLLAVLQGK